MKRIGSGLFACALLGLGAMAPAVHSSGGEPVERAASPRRIAAPTRIPDPIVAETTPATAVQTATVPRAVRRAVVADAAQRFKVAESAVVLARAEQVTWPDGALGCPEPGRMYTQTLVAGYRVVAKTSEGEMLYHTDARGEVRVCGATASRADSVHERLRTPVQPTTNPAAKPLPVR